MNLAGKIDIQSWMMASHDGELANSQPKRPKIIREVPIFQIDEDGILIDGFGETTTIRGAGMIELAEQLYDYCDGQRELNEILLAFPGREDKILQIYQIFIRSGLVEEAHRGMPAEIPTPMANFIARTAKKTGWYASSADVIHKISASHVRLVGSQEFGRQLAERLHEFGMENIRTGLDEIAPHSLLVIEQDCLNQLLPLIGKSELSGVKTLSVGLATDSCSIGPTFHLSNGRAIIDVLSRAAPSASLHGGERDMALPKFAGLDLIAQHVFQYALSLTDTIYHRRMIRLNWDGSNFVQAQYAIGDQDIYDTQDFHAREHNVCDRSSFDRLISVTEMPMKSEIAPTMHLAHYASKNLNLAKAFPYPLNAETIIDLPPVMDGDELLENIHFDNALYRVAALLFFSGGVVERDGRHQRLVPSGGNIGAVEIYLRNFRLDDLPIGSYRYCAVDHCLELIPSRSSGVEMANGQDDIEIVLCGNINKIEGKYGSYAYQLIQYETGVVQQYLRNAAKALDMEMTEEFGTDLTAYSDILRLPKITQSFAPYAASRLSLDHTAGVKWAPAGIPALRRLTQQVWQRHACRHYQNLTVEHDILESLLISAKMWDEEIASRKSQKLTVEYLLLIDEDIPYYKAGAYRQCEVGADIIAAVAHFEQEGVGQFLVNQTELGRAPFKIVPIFNPEQFDTPLLSNEFPELLQRVASVIARLWLELADHGLAGTAAGGILRCELNNRLPEDWRQTVPLLSLCFGVPYDVSSNQ